jgi:hypothetical protein
MSKESIEFVLKNFPATRYYANFKLVTWHPLGIFDEQLADKIVAFIEWEEYVQEAPFDRYTDLSGITDLRISVNHVIETARRRRIVREPVKSAIFADRPISLNLALMYERLMEDAIMLRVRSFRDRDTAAEWLDVPIALLHPPPSP